MRALSYDMIIIPVHLRNHWCLGVIDFTSKQLQYYDSMGGSPGRFFEVTRAWLAHTTTLSAAADGLTCKPFMREAGLQRRNKYNKQASPCFVPFSSHIPSDPLILVKVAAWTDVQEACPQQTNGCDCGPFVLAFAEALARKAPLVVAQRDIPRLRKEICYAILCGSISERSQSRPTPQGKT